MAKKVVSKNDDSKLFAFLAVFFTLIGFIVAYIVKKDDKYVMFYAKQGLVLFICWVILAIFGAIVRYVFILNMVYWIAGLGLFVLWIVGLVNAFSGEMKEIPLVGQFARKFNF